MNKDEMAQLSLKMDDFMREQHCTFADALAVLTSLKIAYLKKTMKWLGQDTLVAEIYIKQESEQMAFYSKAQQSDDNEQTEKSNH
jgi:hypothetical protein